MAQAKDAQDEEAINAAVRIVTPPLPLVDKFVEDVLAEYSRLSENSKPDIS